MKKIKRILIYVTVIACILLLALAGSVFVFKDRIINRFITEANKQLNTPVRIGKIDVSAFEQFPLLSIVCSDVYVEDSHPGSHPLFRARTVSFQLNPLEVWQGIYIIKGLKVDESETNLLLNREGVNNYTIVRKGSGSQEGGMSFELKNVQLGQTQVRYRDVRLHQDFSFSSSGMTASIRMRSDVYEIDVTGQVVCDRLDINNRAFLTGKDFRVAGNLLYDDVRKSLLINPSQLWLKQAEFSVKGTYDWKEKNLIHLETRGENTDIQTLISLLPEETAGRLGKYQSNGDVYFSSRLDGTISATQNPSISIEFGCANATIFHPDYGSRIEDATVEGSYASADLFDTRDATLVLKDIKGTLNGEGFTSNLVVNGFDDPQVICNFKGKLDAPSLINFYPVEGLSDLRGSLLVDVAFEGRIGLLKSKSTTGRVSTQGTVELQDIDLVYGKQKIALQGLTGDLQFNNNDLALSDVAGKLGNSDFLLNGFFKNIVTFIFFEDQPVGIEADLKSDFIDLDEIFALAFGGDAAEHEEYNFHISRNVNLNFNCDIGSLRYKRFKGKALRGDLLVKSQMAVSRNFSLEAMGGQLEISGIVDAQDRQAIDVVTSAKLKNIHLDSVFYVFENFNQDFIEDRHLKGQGFAHVDFELVLNQHLRLIPETLIADIGLTIKNGQLNHFEPMKQLSRYLDDEGLSRLRFSELKNDIHIENKTVYLPRMEVRSNVTDLVISGTHTFDQRIDYSLVTPLRKRKPADPEAQLAIEDDPRTGPSLFLKIAGTTDDYKIRYDTEAVKKKIASDLRKEVQELKDAFRSKGKQKQKELELDKDDYFDWDEN